MHMKNQRGFTLVELMITIVIAAILLAIGIPSMREFIQNGRITAVTNELSAALLVARSEAIRQDAQSCVCPTADATAVVPACANVNTWETGWIAFVDFNGDCVINAAGANTDYLVKAWDGTPLTGQITVRNDDVSINAVNSVRFNTRGEPVANGATQTGTFSICDDRPLVADANGNVRVAAALTLSASGSTRSTRQENQITYTAP